MPELCFFAYCLRAATRYNFCNNPLGAGQGWPQEELQGCRVGREFISREGFITQFCAVITGTRFFIKMPTELSSTEYHDTRWVKADT